jgi:hypothetical protein
MGEWKYYHPYYKNGYSNCRFRYVDSDSVRGILVVKQAHP